jgi:hypothetical protein
MTRRWRLLAVAGGPCAVALLAGATASAAGPPQLGAKPPSTFTIGLTDSVYGIENPTPWFNRTVATGARLVLFGANWANIEPSPPRRGTNPSNPSNPAYHWGTLDRAVRDAAAHRLTVVLSVASAGGPEWVDGPHRPRSILPGTWNPRARAYGLFARAVARRYSGTFNPGGGRLPRVRYFQAWGEPNLNDHLAPQWIRVHGQWKAESPLIYRRLLNAAYLAVKSVHRSNKVVTAGTAPYGDPPGGARMPPVTFVQNLLCLTQRLRSRHCRNPAHFDVLAHDPYDFGGPFQPALNSYDVSLPDFWKLTRLLHAAVHQGLALPRAPKRVWATEFSWDSRPPDPHGVPVIRRARWIEETFHELWREGVSAIVWYLLRDQPPVPNYASTYQSGLYYLSGRAKRGLEGFRFPFVVSGGKGPFTVWGISPRTGRVRVQEEVHGRWRTLTTVRVHAHGVFTRELRLAGHPLMRAVIRRESSLTWRVR